MIIDNLHILLSLQKYYKYDPNEIIYDITEKKPEASKKVSIRDHKIFINEYRCIHPNDPEPAQEYNEYGEPINMPPITRKSIYDIDFTDAVISTDQYITDIKGTPLVTYGKWNHIKHLPGKLYEKIDKCKTSHHENVFVGHRSNENFTISNKCKDLSLFMNMYDGINVTYESIEKLSMNYFIPHNKTHWSNFPNLEELQIKFYHGIMDSAVFSFDKLKKLTVDTDDVFHDGEIIIDAPELRELYAIINKNDIIIKQVHPDCHIRVHQL